MNEISWLDIQAFAEKLIKEPRGHRRAACVIREIASQLAEAQACEELANASMELQRMLVLSWEKRWEKARNENL